LPRHADRAGLDGPLYAGGYVRAQVFRNRCAVLQAHPFVEARPESPAGDALRAEKRAVHARTAIGYRKNLQEEAGVPPVARHREPLHLVLVRIGLHSEQFGYPSVKLAQGIGRVMLVLQRHAGALSLPPRSTAKIAAAVQR